jgi:hypothetical protein
MLDGVTLFPQKLINVRMKPGADWKGSASIRAAIDAAESALAGHGRVLIRASGTEPVLRVMVEGSRRPTRRATRKRSRTPCAKRRAERGGRPARVTIRSRMPAERWPSYRERRQFVRRKGLR